jgi:DNA polymerase-3 subunit epsilon
MSTDVSSKHLETLHNRAVREATDIVRQPEWVVLDFETTAKEPHLARIIQIGAVDQYNAPMAVTLVNPGVPIPRGATAVNGITDEMVANAPPLAAFIPALERLLTNRHVIAYNAEYERKVLGYELRRVLGAVPEWFSTIQWHCAMLLYADYAGDWNDYFGNCRWWKLTEACANEDIEVNGAHSALGDVEATWALLVKMADQI